MLAFPAYEASRARSLLASRAALKKWFLVVMQSSEDESHTSAFSPHGAPSPHARRGLLASNSTPALPTHLACLSETSESRNYARGRILASRWPVLWAVPDLHSACMRQLHCPLTHACGRPIYQDSKHCHQMHQKDLVGRMVVN